MAIQPETVAGRKAYFARMRALVNSQWMIDEEGTVHIPLGDGKEALIDSCDRELASRFMWRLRKHSRCATKFYAEAPIPEDSRHLINSNKKMTSLHRVILNPPEGFHVDHANGNGLDCRRKNIRIATVSQNASNRRYKNKTGYRGVVKPKRGIGYVAQCTHDGKNHNIGYFQTAEEAALAYNMYAVEQFGEFAILNVIGCPNE